MNSRPTDIESEIMNKYEELNNDNRLVKFDNLFFRKINKVGIINALSEKSGLKAKIEKSIDPIKSGNLKIARDNILSQYSYFNKTIPTLSIPQSSHDLTKEELVGQLDLQSAVA